VPPLPSERETSGALECQNSENFLSQKIHKCRRPPREVVREVEELVFHGVAEGGFHL